MKRFLYAAMSAAMLLSAIPISANAETITIEKGAESWSKTYITGDANQDGSVNIADVVILQKYLHGGQVSRSELILCDVNFDGTVNAYDMIALRKNILSPDTTIYKRTYSLDILNSLVSEPDTDRDLSKTEGSLITNKNDLHSLLSLILTDESEIQKYLERYDDEFFADNDLIIGGLVQERGEGIFYAIGNSLRVKDYEYRDETYSGILTLMTKYYEHDPMLYPETNTPILAQVTIPKSQTAKDGEEIAFLDVSYILEPDYSGYYYTSPDGEHELYITQSAFLLMSGINVYIDNHDGTFEYLCSLATDDGHNPFDDKGEWTTDENGETVFTNGESYTFHWYDDHVKIDYTWEGDKWTYDDIYYDGGFIIFD